MGWGAQQWLRFTKEASYGVYDSGASGSDVHWMRLAGGNAFTPREVPQRVIIRSADGGNRRRQVVSARKLVTGTLASPWYPTQSAFVLGAALTLSSNDLASWTADYFDSVQVHRFLGGKCSSLGIDGTAQQDYVPLSMGWQFRSRTTTTLAQPADTVFPSEVPYEHVESAGLLSVGGAQSKYSALSISVKNTLVGTFDEEQWITNLYYCGRDVDLNFRVQYLATTLRAAFEAQTALTISAAWARAAGLASTFDMNTANYVATVSDDIPLDGPAYQSVSLQCFYAQADTTDLSFTVA